MALLGGLLLCIPIVQDKKTETMLVSRVGRQ